MCYAKRVLATWIRHFSVNCAKTGNMWTLLENLDDQMDCIKL